MLTRAQRRCSTGFVTDENTAATRAMGKTASATVGVGVAMGMGMGTAMAASTAKPSKVTNVTKGQAKQPPVSLLPGAASGSPSSPPKQHTQLQSQLPQRRALRRLSTSALTNGAAASTTSSQHIADGSVVKPKKGTLLKEPKNYALWTDTNAAATANSEHRTSQPNDRRMTFSVQSIKPTADNHSNSSAVLPDCFTLDRNEFEMEFERTVATRRQSLAPNALNGKSLSLAVQFQESVSSSFLATEDSTDVEKEHEPISSSDSEPLSVVTAVLSMDDSVSLALSSKKRKSLSPSHAKACSSSVSVVQTDMMADNNTVDECFLRVHPDEQTQMNIHVETKLQKHTTEQEDDCTDTEQQSQNDQTKVAEQSATAASVAMAVASPGPKESVADRTKRRKFSPSKSANKHSAAPAKDAATVAPSCASSSVSSASTAFSASDFEWLSEQLMHLEKQVADLNTKCATLTSEVLAERTAKNVAEQNLSAAREYSKYCEDVIVQREARIEELRKQLDVAQCSQALQTAQDRREEQLLLSQKELSALREDNDNLREENRRLRKQKAVESKQQTIGEEQFHSAAAFFADSNDSGVDSAFPSSSKASSSADKQSESYQRNRRHSLSSAEVLAALQEQNSENGQAAEQSHTHNHAVSRRQSLGGAPSQNENPIAPPPQSRAQRRMTLSTIQLFDTTDQLNSAPQPSASRRLSLSNADSSAMKTTAAQPEWALDGRSIRLQLPRSHSHSQGQSMYNSEDAIRTLCKKYLRAASAIERVHFDNSLVFIQCSDSSSAVYLAQMLTKKDKWDAKYVKKAQQ